jgi:predicted nucleic-acid-binding protein
MLGIDTNVLVRFLVRDDEAQFLKACALIQGQIAAGSQVFINHLVLLETEWVLRSRYQFNKIQLLEVISTLLDAGDVQFEDTVVIEEALFIWKDGATGFADCMIAAKNQRLGCRATATFDVKAAKMPGFVAV